LEGIKAKGADDWLLLFEAYWELTAKMKVVLGMLQEMSYTQASRSRPTHHFPSRTPRTPSMPFELLLCD
jgi:hypothetical protein